MQFIGWMYDLAREQSPSQELLEAMVRRSAAAGYNALGLYLEHRFAYRAAPWAAGPGCLTPDAVRRLCRLARSLPSHNFRIIPFLNTLGHMEGFIRSEGGQWLAEADCDAATAQICPTRPECVSLVRDLVADVLEAFDDEWVHLGGDETRQLGQCPACAARVQRIGKPGLYGEYFGQLCRFVLERGRRPCLWGDMLAQYPEALELIPPQTVIFDWQYFSRPLPTTRLFRQKGFDVVCCPSVQTYNAGWCFLEPSQLNIDQHAADAATAAALGVLVTTWEFCYFSTYPPIFPFIYATGRRLAGGQDWCAAIAEEGGPGYAKAAELLGNAIPRASRFLAFGTWRQLRGRLVISRNPFRLWQAWRAEACGPVGDEILRLCSQIDSFLLPDDPLRFPVQLHRVGVEWVRHVEMAKQAYRSAALPVAHAALLAGRSRLESLRPWLEGAARLGGSPADPHRLERLIGVVDEACAGIERLPTPLGYRPAFEALSLRLPAPGDQAAWTGGPS